MTDNSTHPSESLFSDYYLATGTLLVLLLLAIYAPRASTAIERAANPRNAEGSSDTTELDKSGAPRALDPALAIARDSLERLRANVHDYSAMLVARERIGNKLGDHQFIEAKIRNRKQEGDSTRVPFSVYLRFHKPRSLAGREVIWVEGQHGDRLVTHEGGFKNLMTIKIKPDNPLALFGRRYPATDIGIENLILKLIERAERDLERGECEVGIYEKAKVDGRECTLIQVEHPVQREYYDFFRARIFIDDEFRLPIRYAAWGWPAADGDDPPLLEEYTYTQLKLNVGLTDNDFDPENPEYEFP